MTIFPCSYLTRARQERKKKEKNFFFFLGMIVMVDAWQYDNIYNPHIYLRKQKRRINLTV